MKMKTVLSLSALVAFSAASAFLIGCGSDSSTSPDNASDQVSNTDFTAWEPFSFERSAANRSGIILQGINGAIVITEASSSNSIKISGEKRVESESTEDAQAHLGELEVDVRDLTDRVLVRTVQPKFSGGRHYIVNYTITLPMNLDVTVKSINGRVTLDEILGSVVVVLVNGEIDSKVTLPLDGTIELSITNGSIELDIPQSTSAEVSAKVANGMIGVFNLDFHNRVETSNSLHGTCGDGRGTVSLNAINGDIKVTGF